MTSPNLTYFYVRVPEGRGGDHTNLSHADETVQVAGGYFKNVDGKYIQEMDGTYEVRALSPSNTSTVRIMLTEHEGLIIEREEEREPGIGNLLTTTES